MTMLIRLSGSKANGSFTIVDDYDFLWASKITWHMSNAGYATHCGPRPDKKRTMLHRVVNDTPGGLFTDHINRDKLDNRRSNLRTATHSQNRCNSAGHKDRKVPYKGISFHKTSGLWNAKVQFKGVRMSAGYYKTPEEAADAYEKLAEQLHGKFAFKRKK